MSVSYEYAFLLHLRVERSVPSDEAMGGTALSSADAYAAVSESGVLLVEASGSILAAMNRLGREGWLVDGHGIFYSTEVEAAKAVADAVKATDSGVRSIRSRGHYLIHRRMG